MATHFADPETDAFRYWSIDWDEPLRVVLAEAAHPDGFLSIVLEGQFHPLARADAERLRDALNVTLIGGPNGA